MHSLSPPPPPPKISKIRTDIYLEKKSLKCIQKTRKKCVEKEFFESIPTKFPKFHIDLKKKKKKIYSPHISRKVSITCQRGSLKKKHLLKASSPPPSQNFQNLTRIYHESLSKRRSKNVFPLSPLWTVFQAKSQRDREKEKGQNEHVHNRAFGYGAHVPRHVPQTRQADRAQDGCPTPQDHSGRRHLVHGGPLQAGVPQRSRAQDAHTSSKYAYIKEKFGVFWWKRFDEFEFFIAYDKRWCCCIR